MARPHFILAGNIDFFAWIVPVSYFVIQAVNRLEQEERVR